MGALDRFVKFLRSNLQRPISWLSIASAIGTCLCVLYFKVEMYLLLPGEESGTVSLGAMYILVAALALGVVGVFDRRSSRGAALVVLALVVTFGWREILLALVLVPYHAVSVVAKWIRS